MIPAARGRLVVLYAVVFALLVSLGGRLWYLQVMTGVSYASAATQDQVRSVIVPPVRGQILDDVGHPLIDNHTSLVVSVNRQLVSQQADGGIGELHRLAQLLHMSYTTLQEKIRLCTAGVSQPCWQGSPYQPIPVAQQVPDATALQIMENQREYPGITAEAQPVTHYVQPYATAAAQMLGYLQPITPQEMAQRHLPVTGFSGVDLVGQAGLEEQYDQQLRGTPGSQTLTVNAAGTVTGVRHQTPATPGDTPGDQPQLAAPGGHLQRPGARDPERAGRGQPGRHLRRRRGHDHHRPDSRHGQLPDLRPQHLDRRHLQPGVQEPVRHRAWRADTQPRHPGRIRPRLHLQGHLGRRPPLADGMSAAGPYSCPGSVTIAHHTFNNWTTKNLGPMSLHDGAGLVLRHGVLPGRLPDVPARQLQSELRGERARAHPEDAEDGGELRGSAGTRGSTCRSSRPAPSPPGSGCTTTGSSTSTTGASTATPTAATSSRSPTTTAGPDTSGRPGQAAIAAIGQGYVTVTPLAACPGLRRDRQRRHPVQPPDR